MTDAAQLQARKQAVRLRRFLLASTTYALGLLILVPCSAFGLLAGADLARIGLAFLAVNIAFYAVSAAAGTCASPTPRSPRFKSAWRPASSA